MAQAPLENLESALGYQFRESGWLRRALTHRSYVARNGNPSEDNEQLEFLGDSVLSFIVSERISRNFPALAEGKLSRVRSRLVSATHLAQVGRKLEVGHYLFLGGGEERSGGRTKPALLVDAVEALIAALYRDGGLEAAESFVEKFVLPRNLKAAALHLVVSDHKTTLQEMLQADQKEPPVYRVIQEKGPEHRKTFTVEVRIAGNRTARGRGSSKKTAEQEAAHALLKKIRSRGR